MNARYSRYFIYIKPVFRNPYVKTYSSLVFSLITITIFSLFAIRPTIKTILSLREDISSQKLILEQLKQKTSNLENANRNYEAIDLKTRENLKSLLPDQVIVGKLIDNLSTIATQNEASISGLQFQPLEIENIDKNGELIKSKVVEISFTLNTFSGYPNLINLLDALSNINRLISIDSVNLNKLDSGSLIMSINGRSYYLK